MTNTEISKNSCGQRPVRIAIIGSGPSGFFTSESLLKSGLDLSIDMFEQLPAPFGLVRFGVAPDHPTIKKVIHKFERILQSGAITFYGNVVVGQDISVDELRLYYDVIVLACGALEPKQLNIVGEDLCGSHSAIEFVGWLNGLPRYRQAQFDLSQKIAIIIGHGNVALDVARMLAKSPDELGNTDIAQHALDMLSTSKVQEIYLIGRRGPVQAAFSYKELKDIDGLVSSDFYIEREELILNETSHTELQLQGNHQKQRMVQFLHEVANRSPPQKLKRIELKFLRTPVAIVGTNHVEKLICEKNRLDGTLGKQLAYGTGELEELDCGLIFSSIGYLAKPIKGVPFNHEKGIFENREGRILLNESPTTGIYTVGWVQRGASGLIGNSKQDGAEIAQTIIKDLPSLTPCVQPSSHAVQDILRHRQIKVINFDSWKKIDKIERDRGKAMGKPREKFCSVEEMLGIL